MYFDESISLHLTTSLPQDLRNSKTVSSEIVGTQVRIFPQPISRVDVQSIILMIYKSLFCSARFDVSLKNRCCSLCRIRRREVSSGIRLKVQCIVKTHPDRGRKKKDKRTSVTRSCHEPLGRKKYNGKVISEHRKIENGSNALRSIKVIYL